MNNNEITVEYIDHSGSDLTVVNAARVSFANRSDWDYSSCPDPSGMPPEIVQEYKKLSNRDEKLITYLAEHQHLSPFGHCFATFCVKAPVFVRAQMVKHKFLRVNEVSRRYVDSRPTFFFPECWRNRAENKKQGSGDGEVEDLGGQAIKDIYASFVKDAVDVYESMIASGVAPEMARMVLPQSMFTEWYWSGSLDAFAAMCKLRLGHDAQLETRLVAQYISNMMSELYPHSWKVLMNA